MKTTLPGLILLFLSSVAATGRSQAPAPPNPTDFRIQVGSYGVGEKPVYTEEIVVRSGRIYVFPSNVKEVTLIEPAQHRIDLLDVGRKVQCEIPFATLEASLVKLKDSLRQSAVKLEKQGGKGKLIEARMARDLFETDFVTSFDPQRNCVSMRNPAVEIEAVGVPEEDGRRLVLTETALVNIARLGSFRAPDDLPPFVELRSIAELTGPHKLRPTSITYLYRLAGPPQKLRRTYTLFPKLTDREITAIGRIDRFRELAPSLRYEQYRVDR